MTLDFDVALERRFRLFAVHRIATRWDTRVVPPDGLTNRERAVVYVLVEGSLEWSDGLALRAPGALVAGRHDVLGSRGRRLRSFRTEGACFDAVEIHAMPSVVCGSIDRPAIVDVSVETIAHARTYGTIVRDVVASSPGAADRREAFAAKLLESLRRDGVLKADLASTIVSDERALGALWRAAMPMLESFALSPPISLLSSGAGISVRQAARRFEDFTSTFELPWIGWRDLTRGMRLRVAVLLLSNPEIPIATVASRTGYSSSEALHHALRTEGLPPPQTIRQMLSVGLP